MSQRIILSIFLARVFLFLPFMTVAGCIPILIEEWKIGAAEASSIVSGFYFAYAVSLLGFSWLGDHIGAKRSVMFSAWATAIFSAAFAFFAEDFTSSLILYSLIGLCQGGVYTPLIMFFRENTPPERLGAAIGWLIASTSIGYAASIALTGLSVGLSGWRLAFMVTGLPPVVGTIILLAAIKSLPNVIHPHTPAGLERRAPVRLAKRGMSTMQNQIRLRRMAEGYALVAFPKWKRTGVRISNHSFDLDDQRVEWLSIVRPDGALRFLQHFPDFKRIGVLKPEEVSRLFPRRGTFTSGAYSHLTKKLSLIISVLSVASS